MYWIQRPHITVVSLLAAMLLLPVAPSWGQGLSDIRITEISESGQWFELKNTATGPVDISLAELCANFSYEEAEDLSVEAYDDTGSQDLTLAAGEYVALQWNQIDADNGNFGLFEELGRSLKTMGCIENLDGQVENHTGNVKCSRHSPQRHRWMALSLLEAESRMRRLTGYKDLPKLKRALKEAIPDRE